MADTNLNNVLNGSIQELNRRDFSVTDVLAGNIELDLDLFDFDNLTGTIGDILNGGTDAVLGIIDSLVAELGGTLTPQTLIESFVPAAQLPLLQVPIPGSDPSTTPFEQFEEAFTSNNKELAVQTLVPFTGVDLTDQEQVDAITEGLTSAFDLITVTRAGSILVDRSSLVFPPAYNIGSTFGTDNPAFNTFVSTVEELELEFRSISREISEVIVHSTDTHTNANLDADQVKEMSNHFSGQTSMPYHYIIKRDGSLQRGLHNNLVPEFTDEGRVQGWTSVQNSNTYSILVAMVGGLNNATGASVNEESTQAAAYTREQFNTFWYFMRTFFNEWPGGQALGHGDILGYKNEPGFDVREFCRTEFNKISLYYDPSREPVLDPFGVAEKALDLHPRRTGLSADFAQFDPDFL